MSFNRDDRRGGGGFNRGSQDRRSFGGGGRSFGGGRDSSRPVEMHKAVCSNCGKECEVPFRPTGSKPVFCSDCFREQGGPDRRSEGSRNFERRDDRRDDRPGLRPAGPPPPPIKPQLDELNAKLDRILRLLESNAPKEALEEKFEAPKKPKAAKKVVPVEETVVLEETAETPIEVPVEETTEEKE